MRRERPGNTPALTERPASPHVPIIPTVTPDGISWVADLPDCAYTAAA